MITASFDELAAAGAPLRAAPRSQHPHHAEPHPPPAASLPKAPGPARDISPSLIRAKRPCAEGYRWYLRSGHGSDSYLDLMRALQDAGRVVDASWLLAQFGSTHDVLDVDEISAEAFIFPGTVRVRGNVDVSTVIHIGGDLITSGGVRAGGDVTVGGELRCEGALQVAGQLRCASLKVGMLLIAQGVDCAGALRCESTVSLRGGMVVGEQAVVRGDLEVEGSVDCARSLHAALDIAIGERLRVAHGVTCGGTLACGGPLSVGWGLRAGGDVRGGDVIQVGEGLAAGGEVAAGPGYGIYAGLAVREADWEHSGQVVAKARPASLMSGLWRAL